MTWTDAMLCHLFPDTFRQSGLPDVLSVCRSITIRCGCEHAFSEMGTRKYEGSLYHPLTYTCYHSDRRQEGYTKCAKMIVLHRREREDERRQR